MALLRAGWVTGNGLPHTVSSLRCNSTWVGGACRLPGSSLWPLWLWMQEWGQGTRQSPIPFSPSLSQPPSLQPPQCHFPIQSSCPCTRANVQCVETLTYLRHIAEKQSGMQFNLSTTLRGFFIWKISNMPKKVENSIMSMEIPIPLE